MSDPRTTTEALVAFAFALRYDDVPSLAVERAKIAILDWTGCALAGSTAPVATIASGLFGQWGGAPDAVVIGRNVRLPAHAAALLNGTAGHALNIDDVSVRMGHPSTVLVPALLALAELNKSGGRDVLLGYLAGFETLARLCSEMNPAHYSRGWDPISTIGSVAAAVAGGQVLGLNEASLAAAIGVAASMSSGIRRNVGTMTKQLHAGMAARNGVMAALLAQRGLTAHVGALDGPHGFFDVFGDASLDASLFDTGKPLEIITSGIGLKRFACCGVVHTALDALLSLATTHNVDARDVSAIECAVNRLAPDIVPYHRLRTPLEAMFSMEYCLAVGLTDRDAGLKQFTEERIHDPFVRSLSERVVVSVDESFPIEHAVFPSRVTLRLRDGTSLTQTASRPHGYPSDPLSIDEVIRKFRTCAGVALDATTVEDVLACLLTLDQIDRISTLTAKLSTGA